MSKKLIALLLIVCASFQINSQTASQDTIFLMNGHVVGEKVIDTLLGAITIVNPKKPERKIHYEMEQLYMVKFSSSGYKRFYYEQDSLKNNWFSRDEMWMFMKGERDARKGFKARGAFIGAGIAGLIGGMSGTFWAPIAPYGYMALSGITKIRIRHSTISDPRSIESDAYILGYERVARHKRRIQSIIGGTIGLAIGYGLYAAFHQSYPETINVGFAK